MSARDEWIHVGGHLRRNSYTESDASQFYHHRARVDRAQEVEAFQMNGSVLGRVKLISGQEVMLFPTNPLSDGFRAITFKSPAPGQKMGGAMDLFRYPPDMLLSFSLPLRNLPARPVVCLQRS